MSDSLVASRWRCRVRKSLAGSLLLAGLEGSAMAIDD